MMLPDPRTAPPQEVVRAFQRECTWAYVRTVVSVCLATVLVYAAWANTWKLTLILCGPMIVNTWRLILSTFAMRSAAQRFADFVAEHPDVKWPDT